MGRKLDANKVIETLDKLNRRVEERFPGTGLVGVCADLAALAHGAADCALRLSRPYVWLRAGVAVVILLGFAAQVVLVRSVNFGSLLKPEIQLNDLFPPLEAAVNLLLLFGAAVFFLSTLEERLKRREILLALYELRSIAHVIDMHQLTKDPTIILNRGPRTESSPRRAMTEFQLIRYLEYCTEMHALIGKLAALYSQDSRDPVVIDAVNDVESLTADLGRKIWQKITILHRLDERRTAPAA